MFFYLHFVLDLAHIFNLFVVGILELTLDVVSYGEWSSLAHFEQRQG